MSKKRKHRTGHQASTRYTGNAHRRSPYIRWGIISIIGGLILLAMQLIFVAMTFQPGHRAMGISTLLSILTAPLLIDGILLAVGLIMLAYGLWQKHHQ